MNIEYLKRIKSLIRQYPEHFDMTTYADMGACGTTACIAGWAFVLAYQDKFNELDTPLKALDAVEDRMFTSQWVIHPDKSVFEGAAFILDIGTARACNLFYEEFWPEELKHRYKEAEGTQNHQAMAEIACERIDYFIQHYGNESREI